MPLVPVPAVGAQGINRDTEAILLPPNTWSDGRNVRFDNKSVQKIAGHTSILDTTTEIQSLIYWPRPTAPRYIYADATTLNQLLADGTSASLNPTGFTFNAGGNWQTSLFNGGYTVIANNGIDRPHYISFGNEGQNFQTSFQPLPDWPSTLAAGVVRSYGNLLIAGNLTDRSGALVSFQPGTVRISSQAAPGSVPTSWTVGPELLTTADEFELSTGGTVQEIVGLKNTAMIFTDNSIHLVQPATSRQPTRVDNLNFGKGCLATDCAVELDGSVFVVDRNDIYVTNGSGSIKSVGDEVIRDYFFSNLHGTFFESTYVVRHLEMDEVWICYPTSTQTEAKCNEAIIWNYVENTWTIRDMPDTIAGTIGPSVSGTSFVAGEDRLLFTGYETSTSTTSNHIHIEDSGSNTFNGETFRAYVERTRMDMDDLEATKWSKSFYPIMSGTGSVNISVVGTNTAGATVNFASRNRQRFDIVSDYKVDPRDNGRFVNILIESEDTNTWTLSKYSIDAELKERR